MNLQTFEETGNYQQKMHRSNRERLSLGFRFVEAISRFRTNRFENFRSGDGGLSSDEREGEEYKRTLRVSSLKRLELNEIKLGEQKKNENSKD